MKAKRPVRACLLGAGLGAAVLAWGASDGMREAATLRSASAGDEPRVPPGPVDAAEAQADWFQTQVVAELDRGRSASGGLATRLEPTDELRPETPGETLSGDIDWEYLHEVFTGRVSGVPNERRAGISLHEMVRIGDVPYVEALRRAGDLDALRNLGLGPRPSNPLGPAPEDRERGEYRIVRYPLNPRLEPFDD